MSRASRRTVIALASTLAVVAVVEGVAARGGGRAGGGFSRGGPAAAGSFGQNRPASGIDRGYNARGPAADGNFGADEAQRQERREERQDRRTERREDWQEYAEDHYDDHDDGYDRGDYNAAGAALVGAAVEEPSYWTLPCAPAVMAMGGTVYYVCGAEWYIRAYRGGDVVYTMVAPPTGQ